MNEKIKIYYAAAMLGDRSNLNDNKVIFKGLEKLGYQMLTKFVIEDELDINKGRKLGDIFKRDIDHLNETDVLIADISYPSTGVGFEIAYALLKNKYVIAICRKDRVDKASALIRGINWEKFNLVIYSNPEQITYTLDNIIKNLDFQK